MRLGSPTTAVRADIQALRAFAIAAVLGFHFWPVQVPGGFVGVDIFFVISGFLITGQLWRQIQSDGKIHFGDFWARRARRLFPAAFTVIIFTTVLNFAVNGYRALFKSLNEISGSIFYVQNWVLTAKSVNYSNADNGVSPYQHFWSLSVEEQFYILWPLLLGAVLTLVTLKKTRTTVLSVLAVLTLSSLIWSIYLTQSAPELAYFNTLTRAWEFAAGAWFAIWISKKSGTHRSGHPIWFWIGNLMMLVSALCFTKNLPFPSYWALIPVTGACLTLYSGERGPVRILSFKPTQWLGDNSYSIYLWHWPLLILAPAVLNQDYLELWQIWILMFLVLPVGWLSRKFIEDPIRFGTLSELGPTRQLLVSGLVMATLVGSVQGSTALAFQNWLRLEANTSLQPPLRALSKSTPTEAKCTIERAAAGFRVCHVTVAAGPRVLLAGDSHTRQYFQAVFALAEKYHWSLDFTSKSACSIVNPQDQLADYSHPSCRGYNASLEKYLNEHPVYDLIITSSSTTVSHGRPEVAKSFASQVSKLVKQGQRFLVIRDNPKPSTRAMVCIERFGRAAETKCLQPEARAFAIEDAPYLQVKNLKGVTAADFTAAYCFGGNCPAVIGGITVYRDQSHITYEWAKHLTATFDAALPNFVKG